MSHFAAPRSEQLRRAYRQLNRARRAIHSAERREREALEVIQDYEDGLPELVPIEQAAEMLII